MAAAATLNTAPVEPQTTVPATLEQALDPQWLTSALAPVSGGRAVTSVESVEVIRTVATKVRFAVTFEGDDATQNFCLKGLLNVDEMTAKGGATCVLEGDFYINLAPRLDVQVPKAVAVVTDRTAQQSVLVMRDLIAGGGRFCSALEAFTADQAAESLQQIARLHAGSAAAQGPAVDQAPRRRARPHAAHDPPRSCRSCSTARAATTSRPRYAMASV